jgi:hypothetical protein
MMISSQFEACLRAPIGGSIPERDTQIIERPGWYQVVNPSVREASANEVVFSLIDRGEVDQRIDETFALYDRYGLPFKWCIGPMSTAEIEPRIASWVSAQWGYRGMLIGTDCEIPSADRVTIEKVSESNFEDFLAVNLEGWGLKDFEASVREKMKIVLNRNSTHQYFLARLQGAPVGTAGTIMKQDCGYLVGSVVLEKFRGAGAYRALIQARLRDLSERGLTFAVTHARDATSAPILEKLGFQTAFHAKIFRFDRA